MGNLYLNALTAVEEGLGLDVYARGLRSQALVPHEDEGRHPLRSLRSLRSLPCRPRLRHAQLHGAVGEQPREGFGRVGLRAQRPVAVVWLFGRGVVVEIRRTTLPPLADEANTQSEPHA